jgi:hypothetical protein
MAAMMLMQLFGDFKAVQERPKCKLEVQNEIHTAVMRNRLRQSEFTETENFKQSPDSRFKYLADCLKEELENMDFTSSAKEFTWVDTFSEFSSDDSRSCPYQAPRTGPARSSISPRDPSQRRSRRARSQRKKELPQRGVSSQRQRRNLSCEKEEKVGEKITLKWQISAEGDFANREPMGCTYQGDPTGSQRIAYEWSKCKSEILAKMWSAALDCNNRKFGAEEVELRDYRDSRFHFLFEGLKADLKKKGFSSNIVSHYLVDKRPGPNGRYKMTFKFQMSAEDQ